MMMPKPLVQTSPGSVLSLRPAVPGSPLSITARVDGGVIGYKDLAALPRDKAILEIERPDLMIYQPHYCYSPIESSLSPHSISPPPSPDHLLKETRDWLDRRSGGGSSPSLTNQSRTHSSSTATPSTPPTPCTQATPSPSSGPKVIVQHFHRPENGTNIYKKRPIYKQAEPPAVSQGKHIEDIIIESSKFPSAQPPDPDQPSAIETESWPCPPSTAVIEQESRRQDLTEDDEEDEDEHDEFWNLRTIQKQQLNKIHSNLGKILMKEDLGKSATSMRRKKTRPLCEQRGTTGPTRPLYERRGTTASDASNPAPSSGLSGLQSTEFSSTDKPTAGLQIFPYETLVVTHRSRTKLPAEVDRTQLERHLSEQEFYSVFGMTLGQFDKLSLWKRNNLKRRVCLF